MTAFEIGDIVAHGRSTHGGSFGIIEKYIPNDIDFYSIDGCIVRWIINPDNYGNGTYSKEVLISRNDMKPYIEAYTPKTYARLLLATVDLDIKLWPLSSEVTNAARKALESVGFKVTKIQNIPPSSLGKLITEVE